MSEEDARDLAEFRAAKDAHFREDAGSPLTPAGRRAFTGLAYYDYEPALVFEVTPEPYEDLETIEMGTSDGDVREYERWARIGFTVDGAGQSLTVFRDTQTGEPFLPFVDAGAGTETYGAGRYLDLPEGEGGRLLVDFNYAYQPYCAYNPGYSCPIPPAENRLSVHIRAGERLSADVQH